MLTPRARVQFAYTNEFDDSRNFAKCIGDLIVMVRAGTALIMRVCSSANAKMGSFGGSATQMMNVIVRLTGGKLTAIADKQ